MSTLGGLEYALVFGMRHALDVDHVAAVGTLIERDSRVRAVTGVAARWALGHAVTLLSVGVALILVGLRLPSQFETLAEGLVAGVLIALGLRRLLARGHGSHQLARGAFAVGILHGLAGSGPMVLLAISTLDHKLHALLYLGLVAFGTLLGMVAMAGLFSLPLSRAVGKQAVQRRIEVVAGMASIAAGLRVAYEMVYG